MEVFCFADSYIKEEHAYKTLYIFINIGNRLWYCGYIAEYTYGNDRGKAVLR